MKLQSASSRRAVLARRRPARHVLAAATDAFCLLQPAPHFAASALYTAAFATALTAPCRALDPSAVF